MPDMTDAEIAELVNNLLSWAAYHGDTLGGPTYRKAADALEQQAREIAAFDQQVDSLRLVIANQKSANVALEKNLAVERRGTWRHERMTQRQMTDTVTISRACLQHSRECAWLIYFDDRDMPPEIFTGCGAEDAAHKRFKMVSGNWNCTLFQSVSPSPPPPSGLREALEDIKKWLHAGLNEHLGSYTRATYLEMLRRVNAALAASPSEPAPAKAGDGWVTVDESHPLPHDLQAGDMVKTVKTATVLKRTNDLIWVEAAFSTLGYETMKPEVITHYRRRPSAEQGG